ncbi:unnamed protein product [Closterium sp. NIES-53]
MASRTPRSSGASPLRTPSQARPLSRFVSHRRCIPLHTAVLLAALTIAASMGLAAGLTSAKDAHVRACPVPIFFPWPSLPLSFLAPSLPLPLIPSPPLPPPSTILLLCPNRAHPPVDALGDMYSGFNRSSALQTWTWGDPCGSDGSENAGSPWHGITCDVSADPQRVIEMYVAPTAAAAAAVG